MLKNDKLHFDKSARTYDSHSTVQKDVANELISICPEKSFSKILEIGSGTGHLSRQLIDRNPDSEFTFLDSSVSMLELLKSAIPSNVSAEYCIKSEDVFCKQIFDLCISSSTFQWIRDLDLYFKNIYHTLNANSYFCFSMFVEGTLLELHSIRNKVAPDIVPQHSMKNVEFVINVLEKLNFNIEFSNLSVHKIYYPDFKTLINSLKASGVLGGHLSQGKRLLTRGELKEIEKQSEARYREEQGLPVSYKALLVRGRKL